HLTPLSASWGGWWRLRRWRPPPPAPRRSRRRRGRRLVLALLGEAVLAGVEGGLLDLRRGERAQVVGGLQAELPGREVDVVEELARAPLHEDVVRLALVHPL